MSNAPRIDDIEKKVNASSVNNLFINSAMDFWQRGTSISAPGNTVFYGTADRWAHDVGGGGADGDFERSTDVPNSLFKYSLLATATGDGGDTIMIGQRLEAGDIRPYIGRTMTVSFWAKASSALTHSLSILTPVGAEDTWDTASLVGNTSGGIDIEEFKQNLNFTTSWIRYSYTFVVPATAADGLAITLGQIATAATSDEFYTTGWMLHEGSEIVDFQRAGRNMQDELSMCQRYHVSTNPQARLFAHHGTGFMGNPTLFQGSLTLPVSMRIVPSASLTGAFRISTLATTNPVNNGSLGIGTSGSLFNGNILGFSVSLSSGSATAGQGASMGGANDVTAKFSIDAEL